MVAGIRTPEPIVNLKHANPVLYNQIAEIADRLENHYKDVQDVEFTVEHGNLFILQTRSAKRNAHAAIKTATDMVKEGLITKEEAIARVNADELTQLFVPQFDSGVRENAISTGNLLGTGLWSISREQPPELQSLMQHEQYKLVNLENELS